MSRPPMTLNGMNELLGAAGTVRLHSGGLRAVLLRRGSRHAHRQPAAVYAHGRAATARCAAPKPCCPQDTPFGGPWRCSSFSNTRLQHLRQPDSAAATAGWVFAFHGVDQGRPALVSVGTHRVLVSSCWGDLPKAIVRPVCPARLSLASAPARSPGPEIDLLPLGAGAGSGCCRRFQPAEKRNHHERGEIRLAGQAGLAPRATIEAMKPR